MKQAKIAAERVEALIGGTMEQAGSYFQFTKERTITFDVSGVTFSCTFELSLSFEDYREDGTAFNRAEIILSSEECRCFITHLIGHERPLPANYSQWQVENPNVSCIYIEARERPEHFAERLAAVLEKTGQAAHAE